MDQKNEIKKPSLEELMQKNLEVSEQILQVSKYLKRFIVWHRTWNIIKWSIILVPIILGFIYLPPMLKDFFKEFSVIIDSMKSLQH